MRVWKSEMEFKNDKLSLEIFNGSLEMSKWVWKSEMEILNESLEIWNGKLKMIKWVWKSEMEIWMRVLNNFNDFDNFYFFFYGLNLHNRDMFN